MIPTKADTVVYRHPCACKSASRPLADGEEPVHRFDVDGHPFPWHISEEGPSFTRLRDDLWRVDVEIYGVLKNAKPDQADVIFTDRMSTAWPLTIAGREFPWTVTGDGITYTHSHKTLPMVKLGFLTNSVDTDTDVTDQRRIDQTITDNNGDTWHLSAHDAALDEKMRELTENWPHGVYNEETKTVVYTDPTTNEIVDKGWWWTDHSDGTRTCHHPNGTELVIRV